MSTDGISLLFLIFSTRCFRNLTIKGVGFRAAHEKHPAKHNAGK